MLKFVDRCIAFSLRAVGGPTGCGIAVQSLLSAHFGSAQATFGVAFSGSPDFDRAGRGLDLEFAQEEVAFGSLVIGPAGPLGGQGRIWKHFEPQRGGRFRSAFKTQDVGVAFGHVARGKD